MTIVHLILILLLFVCSSCSSEGGKGEKIHSDSCKVIISNFNYPNDLNRIDSLKYICSPFLLENITDMKELRLSLSFNDKNFSLFNYDFRTKLLYDKRNDLLLCFKHDVDYHDFSRKSIESVYILDSSLMPQYILRWRFYVDNDNYIEKLYYGDVSSTPYFLHIKLKRGNQPQLNKLNYDDIVEITKELIKGRYTLTKERYSLDAHFKTIPLWTDN